MYTFIFIDYRDKASATAEEKAWSGFNIGMEEDIFKLIDLDFFKIAKLNNILQKNYQAFMYAAYVYILNIHDAKR